MLLADALWVSVLQSAPSLVDCARWDGAFLTAFQIGLYVTFFVSVIASIGIPRLFGHRFWWATSVPLRSVWIGLSTFLIAAGIWVLLPFISLGIFPYMAVDPQYVACGAVNFGAKGFFSALMGEGLGASTRAMDQVPLMVGLLFLSVLLGVLSVVGTEQVARRTRGVQAQA